MFSRNSILGIIAALLSTAAVHTFRETSWAIFVERVLEEAAHSLHIPKAGMVAFLSEILILGFLIWLGLHLAFRLGKRERPTKEDPLVLAHREHVAAIAEQTQALRSPATQTVRTAFSQTQSIKILPPILGGNMTLTLDNVATLRLHGPYSMSALTLLLDVVPMALRTLASPGVKVDGAEIFFHDGKAPTFAFGTQDNKRHEITVAGRTFIVTLLRVGRPEVKESVANPIEYVFGISEK